MKILMGIGNDLRGDDGVGVYIAKKFKKDGWYTIEAGTVPEDFTSEIKRINPELLVMVDAAQMGLAPGEIRIVPVERIPKAAFSTHGMPLSILISYLHDYVGKIILIGIQPKNMVFGAEMSDEVIAAAEKLLRILYDENFEIILSL